MQATVIGSPVLLSPGQVTSPGAQAITVPADAEGVLVFTGLWDTNLASLTSNFSSAFTLVLSPTDSFNDGAVSYARVTSTGSKTITPVWSALPGEGPIFYVVFVKDIPKTGAWIRAADAQNDAGGGAFTLNIASRTTDLVLGFDIDDFAPPANQSGWTSLASALVSVTSGRLRSLDAPGATTSGLTTQGTTAGGRVAVIASIMSNLVRVQAQSPNSYDFAGNTIVSTITTTEPNSSIHLIAVHNAGATANSINSVPPLPWVARTVVNDGVRVLIDYTADRVPVGSYTTTIGLSASVSARGAVAKEIAGTTGYDAVASAAKAGQVTAVPGLAADGITTGNTSALSAQPALISAGAIASNGGLPGVGTGFTGDGICFNFGGNIGQSESKRVTSTSALAATFTAANNNPQLALAAVFTEGVPTSTVRVGQQTESSNSAAATTLVINITPAEAGSSLHLPITCSTGFTINTVVSSPALTWTQRNAIDDGNQALFDFTADNVTAVAHAITITFSGSASYRGAFAKEILGTSGYDAAASAAHAAAITASPGTGADGITTGNTSALSAQPALISAACTPTTTAAGTGFTLDGTGWAFAGDTGASESKRVTATTALAATFTAPIDTPFLAVASVFLESVGGSAKELASSSTISFSASGDLSAGITHKPNNVISGGSGWEVVNGASAAAVLGDTDPTSFMRLILNGSEVPLVMDALPTPVPAGTGIRRWHARVNNGLGEVRLTLTDNAGTDLWNSGWVAATSTMTVYSSAVTLAVTATRFKIEGRKSVTTGLDFPSNVTGSDTAAPFVAMQFLNPQSNGLPIWGTGSGAARTGATYIWKYRPRQQTGYYTTMWWSNNGSFLWDGGGSNTNTYYGGHPYPQNSANTGTTHWWEVAGGDSGSDQLLTLAGTNRVVVKDVWHTQAIRVIVNGDGSKTIRFYLDLPNLANNDIIQKGVLSTWGETNPPNPALTFGDSPWYASFQHERMSGIFRGLKIFNRSLSEAEMLTEAGADPVVTSNIWYANPNPTPDDITDKSGQGHDFTWADTGNKATLWTA